MFGHWRFTTDSHMLKRVLIVYSCVQCSPVASCTFSFWVFIRSDVHSESPFLSLPHSSLSQSNIHITLNLTDILGSNKLCNATLLVVASNTHNTVQSSICLINVVPCVPEVALNFNKWPGWTVRSHFATGIPVGGNVTSMTRGEALCMVVNTQCLTETQQCMCYIMWKVERYQLHIVISRYMHFFWREGREEEKSFLRFVQVIIWYVLVNLLVKSKDWFALSMQITFPTAVLGLHFLFILQW